MEYQEKLRLAKEALDSGSYDKETIEYIFPELKETEDERIRKAIFKALSKKDARDVLLANRIQVSDALDWLEKQGDKKEKQYITITQKILDYIGKHESSFENSIPKLGDSWKVIKICKYPSVNDGKPVVEVVNEDNGDWMRLPLNIVNIKIEQKPIWSKEDEDVINHLLNICTGAKGYKQFAGCPHDDITKYQIWLESLKNRMKGE